VANIWVKQRLWLLPMRVLPRQSSVVQPKRVKHRARFHHCRHQHCVGAVGEIVTVHYCSHLMLVLLVVVAVSLLLR
jgi:hypothetical protein